MPEEQNIHNDQIENRDARRELIQLEIAKKAIRDQATSATYSLAGTEMVLRSIFSDDSLDNAVKIEAVKLIAVDTEFSHMELVRILKKLVGDQPLFAELQTKLVRYLPLIFVPEAVPASGNELVLTDEMELRLAKAVQLAESGFDLSEMSPENFKLYAIYCSDEYLMLVSNVDSEEEFMTHAYREALVDSMVDWTKRHPDQRETKMAFVKKCFEDGGVLDFNHEVFGIASDVTSS